MSAGHHTRIALWAIACLVLVSCREVDSPKPQVETQVAGKRLPGIKYTPLPATLPPAPSGELVTLTEANADAVVRDVLIGLRYALALDRLRPVPPPLGVAYKEKEVVIGGGAITRSMRFNRKGLGWSETRYAGAAEIVAGRLATKVLSRDKLTGLGSASLAIDGYRTQVGGEDYTVWANLTATLGSPARRMSGDIVVRRADGHEVQLRGFDAWFDQPCPTYLDCPAFNGGAVALAVTADVYLAGGGRVRLQSVDALQHSRAWPSAPARGELRLQGTAATPLRVRIRSTEWLAFFPEIDTDGYPVRIATRSIPDLLTGVAPALTPVAPLAVTTRRETIEVGSSYRYSAIQSSDGNGDPLTARWRVLASTQGATLRLDQADRAEVTITALSPGEAVVELTVDDGAHQSSSSFVLTAVPSSAPPITRELVVDDLLAGGGDRRAAVGEPVEFDFRGSQVHDLGPWTTNLALDTDFSLDGSFEVLGGGRFRFVGHSAGLYRVMANTCDGCGYYTSVATIAVGDTPLPHDALQLVGRHQSPVHAPTLGDLDGDGLVDVVGIVEGYASNTTRIAVIRQLSPGRFGARELYDSGNVQLVPPRIIDVDDDGRVDIVAWTPGYAVVLFQQGDGGFAAALGMHDQCAFVSWMAFPALADGLGDYDGDGTAELAWTARSCSTPQMTRLVPPDANSTLWHGETAAIPFVKPASDWIADLLRAYFADFDGDGRGDVVGYERHWTTGAPGYHQELRFYAGQTDGSLLEAGTVQLHANSDPYPETGDLDGDGVPEVVSRWTGRGGEFGGGAVVMRRSGGAWTGVTLDLPDSVQQHWLADVDADGDQDVVMRDDRWLRVARWASGGLVLGPRQPRLGGAGTLRIEFGDLDGDGGIDQVDDDLYLVLTR